MIIRQGEKIHIIERRYFENDLRRHFVGEVMKCENNIIRIKGYAFTYNFNKATFIKKLEKRERLINTNMRLIINIIPQNVDIEKLEYITKNGETFLTDLKNFSLELSEFIQT